jgi:hypothetical protein
VIMLMLIATRSVFWVLRSSDRCSLVQPSDTERGAASGNQLLARASTAQLGLGLAQCQSVNLLPSACSTSAGKPPRARFVLLPVVRVGTVGCGCAFARSNRPV